MTRFIRFIPCGLVTCDIWYTFLRSNLCYVTCSWNTLSLLFRASYCNEETVGAS